MASSSTALNFISPSSSTSLSRKSSSSSPSLPRVSSGLSFTTFPRKPQPFYHHHRAFRANPVLVRLPIKAQFFEGGFGGEDEPPNPFDSAVTVVDDNEEPQCPPGLRQHEPMAVLRPDMSEDERPSLTQKSEQSSVGNSRGMMIEVGMVTSVIVSLVRIARSVTRLGRTFSKLFEGQTFGGVSASLGRLKPIMLIVLMIILLVRFTLSRRCTNLRNWDIWQLIKFPQSKPQARVDGSTGCTVNDVAGIEESVEELQEVVLNEKDSGEEVHSAPKCCPPHTPSSHMLEKEKEDPRRLPALKHKQRLIVMRRMMAVVDILKISSSLIRLLQNLLR